MNTTLIGYRLACLFVWGTIGFVIMKNAETVFLAAQIADIERMEESFEKEFAALDGGHDWAGKYHRGIRDGKTIDLGSDNRFLLTTFHHSGPSWDQWKGTARWRGNTITMSGFFGFAYDAAEREDWDFAASFFKHELQLIRWGSRRYLVSRRRMKEFCEKIAADAEQREGDLSRFFFLRRGDEKKAATGRPVLRDGSEACPASA